MATESTGMTIQAVINRLTNGAASGYRKALIEVEGRLLPVQGVRCVWLDEDDLEYQLDDPTVPEGKYLRLVAILETE